MKLCYLCEKELREHDLVIPVNIMVQLPYGHFHTTVLQHYMCGLECYLDIERLKQLNIKDRINIEAKLMEVLTLISTTLVN